MNYSLLIAALVSVAVILVFLVIVGFRALKRPRITGYEGMVGECGIVRKLPGFRGRQVMEIRGELWWCRSAVPIPPGREARVVSYEQNDPVLTVEPCKTER